MLNPSKKRESLAGKLLLSSALVAVSLIYGWWQRTHAAGPILAMAPKPQPSAPVLPAPVPDRPMMSAAPTQPAAPEVEPAPSVKETPTATPPPHNSLAKAVPQPNTATVVPAAPPQQGEAPPAPAAPSPLTAQQAMQMNLPTDGPSPPLPMATGAPEPGAGSPAPAGAHLADGDYVSDRQEMAWGDLRVRISIHGGLITAVQILQYPDHRSQSLYLSQMAGPILESEVIKSQKAQVDTVSSATDTSYSFQDTVANAITKATRE